MQYEPLEMQPIELRNERQNPAGFRPAGFILEVIHFRIIVNNILNFWLALRA